MNRWRALAIGSAAGCALALAATGCGSQPGASAPSHPAASSAAARARPSATAPASASTSSAAVVYLLTSQPVPFTGDSVTLTVQATAGPGSPQWLRLASATVRFGDGTTATVTSACAGTSLPPASAGLLVRHVYQHPGVVSPQVTDATVCGQAGKPTAQGLAGATVSMRVLPAAPAASASWPECTRTELAITATGTGAGLGHVGVLFTLHNTSSVSCRLYGYPGLQLLGSSGQALPTTVVRAVSGAYLFPAVTPHWVALPPAAEGSFDLQYEDNPSGSAANEPYATACPTATQVEVTLPNADNYSVIPASMAPCEGQVLVSPVVPGVQWLAP